MPIKIALKGLSPNGDIDLDSTGALYIGNQDVDGSWRLVRSGNDFSFQRRESGTWVEKGSMQS